MFFGLFLGHFVMTEFYSWIGYAPSYLAITADGPVSDALLSHVKKQLIPVLGFLILMGALVLPSPRGDREGSTKGKSLR